MDPFKPYGNKECNLSVTASTPVQGPSHCDTPLIALVGARSRPPRIVQQASAIEALGRLGGLSRQNILCLNACSLAAQRAHPPQPPPHTAVPLLGRRHR